MRLQLCLSALFYTMTALAAGPPSSDWGALEQLRAGDPIEVVRAGGSKVRGRFAGVSANEVTVEAKTLSTAIARDQTERVRVRRGWTRGRKALVGAAVGAGILATAGLVIIGGLDAWGSEDAGAIVLGLGAFGAGIGAAFAAALPVKWRTVYQAPRPGRSN